MPQNHSRPSQTSNPMRYQHIEVEIAMLIHAILSVSYELNGLMPKPSCILSWGTRKIRNFFDAWFLPAPNGDRIEVSGGWTMVSKHNMLSPGSKNINPTFPLRLQYMISNCTCKRQKTLWGQWSDSNLFESCAVWDIHCYPWVRTPRKHPSCVLRCAESQPVTILPTSATARCQHLCEMITVLGRASNGGEISGKNRLKNPIEVYFLLFSQIDAQTLQNCANKKCPRSSVCTTAPQKSRVPNRLGSLRSPQSKASPGCTKPRQHVFWGVIADILLLPNMKNLKTPKQIDFLNILCAICIVRFEYPNIS